MNSSYTFCNTDERIMLSQNSIKENKLGTVAVNHKYLWSLLVEKNVMKTSLLTLAAITAIALASAQAFAQEKGATRLMKLKSTGDVQQIEAGDTIVMSCPKCQDIYVTVVTKPMKGMQPAEVQQVAKHLCPGCTTTIKTEGVGKNAKDKLVHTCNSCGSADVYCCTMKKGGGPTPGMEEKK